MSHESDHTSAKATTERSLDEGGWPPEPCDVEDLWMAWRDACDDLRQAHCAWRESARAGRRDAYFVVVAAADREAIAAETLSRITPLPSCLSSETALTGFGRIS
jgi:hypothetical protein